MGRTCGEPDEIKKNTHPKNITALFREQDLDLRPAVEQLLRDGLVKAANTGTTWFLTNGYSTGVAHFVGEVLRDNGQPKKRARNIFSGWVFFLISLGGQAPHVLRAHMRAGPQHVREAKRNRINHSRAHG